MAKEVIGLKASYNILTVKTIQIKYEDDGGNKYKTNIPKFRGGGAEEFLNFLTEFNDFCYKVEYVKRE